MSSMTGDAHGTQGDLPTSGLARPPQPRSETGSHRDRSRWAGPAGGAGTRGRTARCTPPRSAPPPVSTCSGSHVVAGPARHGGAVGRPALLRRPVRAATPGCPTSAGAAAPCRRCSRSATSRAWPRSSSAPDALPASAGGSSVPARPPAPGRTGRRSARRAGDRRPRRRRRAGARRPSDAVAVGPAPGWTAVRLQQLARDLDYSRTALLVDRG